MPSSLSTSTVILNILGGLALALLAVYVLWPGFQDTRQPYSSHPLPIYDFVNGFGVITDGPDAFKQRVQATMTDCLAAQGLSPYNPTETLHWAVFQNATFCVVRIIGR